MSLPCDIRLELCAMFLISSFSNRIFSTAVIPSIQLRVNPSASQLSRSHFFSKPPLLVKLADLILSMIFHYHIDSVCALQQNKVHGSCFFIPPGSRLELYTMQSDPDGFCEDCVKHTNVKTCCLFRLLVILTQHRRHGRVDSKRHDQAVIEIVVSLA